MMKYSWLMSVYFREDPTYLKAAIESMLNQTYKSEEILIVCDGKLTEELDKVIYFYSEKYPELFTILRLEKNLGLGVALAAGLEKCRNNIIARMDSDDISLPDRMEKQIGYLEQHDELSVLGGQISEFCGEVDNIVDYRRVPLDNDGIFEMMKSRNPMNHVTTVLKKDDVLRCGNYEAIYCFEDYQLWVKMLCNGCVFANIDDVCVNVRVSRNMYMRRSGKSYHQGSMALDKALKDYGCIGNVAYIKNLIVRFIGYRLLPASVRKFIYSKFMRQKV